MKTPEIVIKTRTRLGQLRSHGIEASRTTGRAIGMDGPDAVLVAADGRVWLLAIWAGEDVQPSLIPEGTELGIVAGKLWAWRERVAESSGLEKPGLVILAPALSTAERIPGVWVVGRKACERSGPLAEAISSCPTPEFSLAAVAHWRSAAVPEVKLESSWRRRRSVRVPEVLAAPMLLDYKQERCVRLDVEDEALAKPLASDFRLRVITGVAGCGKTLVLMQRARLLGATFPGKRVVLVSFNRPLTHELKRRLHRVPEAARVECLTFHQWLYRILPPGGEMLSEAELLRWVEGAKGGWPALAKRSVSWLVEELHWILDQGLAGEEYLTAPRKGRKTRINLSRRQAMVQLLTRFRAYLRESGRADWSEWPLRVLENPPSALRSDLMDHLLIDEAQFFAPVWIQLLKLGLKPGGHVFVCADPTQGFLRRGTSWTSLGIDARSRSVRLEQPYRSTRAILEFAREFYCRRLPEDDEPLNLPESEVLQQLEPGEAPQVRAGGSGQEQMERLAKELAELRAQGFPVENVLILIAGRSVTEASLVQYLNARLGPGSAASVKDPTAPLHAAGVAHLMAATGLERQIVFLLTVDELAEEESNPLLTEEDRAEKALTHTRLIYVGLTRAMDRVVIYAGHPKLTAAFGSAGGVSRH